MWHIWLIAAGIFFIFEIYTVGFLVFWFGIGALAAMIVSFFTSNVAIQATVFLITSTVLILLTKPLVDKFIGDKKTPATNAFSIIGKKAIVTEEINNTNGTGQIKVNGEVWSARCEYNEIIPKDTEVEISKISGVKAVVTKD